jgi:hypothetical protein
MKKAIAFLFVFLSLSCQFVDKKVPSEKELFDKQLKEINWKDVDEYPSVTDCENLTNAVQRKQCFFDFLQTTITQKLALDSLVSKSSKLDTIEVKVTVQPDATLLFEPEFPKDSVTYDVIKIDSILHARLINFPKVKPAIKRGIPVRTQFVLPVIIKQE